MPGYDACLVEAELRTRGSYAEPGRFYHDQRHLDDCLRLLDTVTDLSEREQRVLRWAILWHDAVYDPTRDDNEEQSAALASRELVACGIDPAEAKEVARLIGLTSGHLTEASDRLGALLVSIDLSILGSDAERYRAYAGDVRREYAHLTDEQWRGGRAQVLKRLLAADPLYPDAGFRSRLEDRARLNITEELKRLSAG